MFSNLQTIIELNKNFLKDLRNRLQDAGYEQFILVEVLPSFILGIDLHLRLPGYPTSC